MDSSTKMKYAGLLAIGDEILEVNGEKVASLSLDQVTHLLTRNTSALLLSDCSYFISASLHS